MSAFDEPRARSLAMAAVADPGNACCESDMEEAIVDLQRNQFNAGMERAEKITLTTFPNNWLNEEGYKASLTIAAYIRKEISND